MKKPEHLGIEDIPLPREKAHFVIEYCKDTNIHRAAAACGLEFENVLDMRADPDVNMQIQRVLQSQLTTKDITPNWLMQELYYLYLISTQSGKLSVALQTLKTIGALGTVDAYAAEKVELKSDRDVIDRLMRERKRRLGQLGETETKVHPFNVPDKPSFL